MCWRNCRRSDIRAKYGLPDTIVDDIGFSKLTEDYDALMIEAGTVKSGQHPARQL